MTDSRKDDEVAPLTDEAFDIFNPNAGDWQQQLAMVIETMREISSHTDPQDMVREYGRRMRSIIASDRFLSLTRRGVEEPDFIIARNLTRDQDADSVNPWRDRDKLPRLSGGLLGELVYSNEARVLEDFEFADDDPAADLLRGHRLLVTIPVFDQGQSMNMMVQLYKDPASFDRLRLPQLVWTSNLFGRATHNLVLNKELTEAYKIVDQELQVISDIQRSLLPRRLPDVPGLDLAAYYSPARQAGGDYYDFFPLADGKWGILLADVAGHGTPAAVHVAITHTLAHTRPHYSTHPADLVSYINHNLATRYTMDSGLFITGFFAVYDPAHRTISYTSAGHPPPRVKRCSDGSLFTLNQAAGLPMGILPDAEYPTASVELSSGDQLIFYTDGITEAFNGDNEMFGIERLDQALENCTLTAQGLIDDVLARVDDFTGAREADDDRTVLVAKVK